MNKRVFFLGLVLFVAGFTPAAVYAQADVDIVQNTTALVVAIGSAVGAVGAIIVAVAKFAESKGLIQEGDHELYNKIVLAGEGLQGTDRWIQENEQRMNTLISVFTTLSPEAKKALEANGLTIEKLRQDAEASKRELDRIYGVIPN